LDGLNQQVVKIKRVVADEAFLVELEDAGDGRALFVVVFDARRVGFGVVAVTILRARDCALRGALPQLLFIVAQILDALFDEPDGIVLIVDGKGARIAEPPGLYVLAQDADAEAVKG
jgi:hypothetical protein